MTSSQGFCVSMPANSGTASPAFMAALCRRMPPSSARGRAAGLSSAGAPRMRKQLLARPDVHRLHQGGGGGMRCPTPDALALGWLLVWPGSRSPAKTSECQRPAYSRRKVSSSWRYSPWSAAVRPGGGGRASAGGRSKRGCGASGTLHSETVNFYSRHAGLRHPGHKLPAPPAQSRAKLAGLQSLAEGCRSRVPHPTHPAAPAAICRAVQRRRRRPASCHPARPWLRRLAAPCAPAGWQHGGPAWAAAQGRF